MNNAALESMIKFGEELVCMNIPNGVCRSAPVVRGLLEGLVPFQIECPNLLSMSTKFGDSQSVSSLCRTFDFKV